MENTKLYNDNWNLLNKLLFHSKKMKDIHRAPLCIFQFSLPKLFTTCLSFYTFFQVERRFHCVVLATLELTKINLLSDGIKGVYNHTQPLFVSLLVLPPNWIYDLIRHTE